MLARSVIGAPVTIRAGLDALVEETRADELMLVSDVYDFEKRLRSIELIRNAWRPAETDPVAGLNEQR